MNKATNAATSRFGRAMGRDVLSRLVGAGYSSFRTVVVTVRFADFETKSCSHTLPRPTGSLKDLEVEAMKLFLPFLDRRENPQRKLIRLIGVRVEKLGRDEPGNPDTHRAASGPTH